MTRTALEELGAYYRISNGYHDIRGYYHATSDDTRRALLAAMGIAVSSEAEVHASLKHCREFRWQRMLPSVKVCNEHEPIQIPVTLPHDQQDKVFRWVIESENGFSHAGEFRPKDLAVLDEDTVDNICLVRFNLSIDLDVKTGYHRLGLERTSAGGRSAQMRLIIAPTRCYVPEEIRKGKRLWGVAIQLYAVRSERNWGIGDFGDLINIINKLSRFGCYCIGLNPLHALYPHEPGHASPYSPSSRLFLNPLYIDIDRVEDFKESWTVQERVAAEVFQQRLAELRHCSLVDYEAVAQLKNRILSELYAHFRRNHVEESTSRGQAFRRFQQTQGSKLRKHALFEALCARVNEFGDSTSADRDWNEWPSEFCSDDNDAVMQRANLDDSTVEFYEYLQWLIEIQLKDAYQAALDHGLTLGLYQDLAVGSDLRGSDTWGNPSLYAHSAHIGAPPDAFSLTGQDWSLAPYIPHQLEDLAYEPFIDLLRRNMVHAGVLRIDHVMGLQRLFWVPDQAGVPGTYIDYSMQDLLGILALESQRSRCLIIGEDLGTVSDEIRASMSEHDIFSYKVFYFEKYWQGDHSYKPANAYPQYSLATATTHDLPTVKGFWCEADLKLRDELGLFPDAETRDAQYSDRYRDRHHLIMALEKAGLWQQAETIDGDMPPWLNEALHVFLARSSAALMMVQVEDMLQVKEQANLPATTSQYPNWRLKLPARLESWLDDPSIVHLLDRIRVERSQSP